MLKSALVLVLCLCTFATLASACSDGGSNDGSPALKSAGRPANHAAGEETAAEQPDGQDAEDPGSTEEATPVQTTVAQEFEAARQAFASATFRAEYEDTTSAELETTITLYKDGGENLRFDVRGEQDGEEVELTIIEAQEQSGFCLRNAGEFAELFGANPGEGICFDQDPGAGAPAGDLSARLETLRGATFEVTDATRREIADTDARCYETRDALNIARTYCLSDNGVLLAEFDAQGNGIEATDVSDSVDGDDFELPYPVRLLPSMDQQQ